VAGAGSPALRSLLEGPLATGTVVHAGAQAVYADISPGSPDSPDGAPSPRIVGVLARAAVHLPCGIATALAALPDVPAGAPVRIGGGVLRVGPMRVGVDRLVSFAVPPVPADLGRRLAAVPTDLTAATRQLPAAALELLAAGDAAAVPMLVGRGDGLTPVGDDVLCGWLVAARAAGRDTAGVADAVRRDQHRTTLLSATLLRHAAAGEAIAPFRAVLAGRDPAAVTALQAVGHTSGTGMLLGAHLALCRTLTHEALEGSTR